MDRDIPLRERRQKRLKRWQRPLGVGTVAAIGLITAFFLLEEHLPAANLDICTVERGSIEMTVSASGKLIPLLEEIIVSPIESRITEVYKQPGDSVRKGEPLLKMELASVETEYRQKKDEYEMTKSKLIQVQVRLDNTLSELRMQQKMKQMHAKQLASDLHSEQELNRIGAGTPDRVRRAELNYEEAKLQLSDLEQKIENEKRNAEAELRVQYLELNIQERALEEKARLLKDARILSPQNAILTFINNQIGARITPGMQIAIVSDLTRFKIDAEIADSHRDKLSIGAKAIIKADDIEIPGTVVSVTPSITNGIVRFTVIPEQSDHSKLRSGLNADVYVQYGLRRNVLRIPNRSFFKFGPGKYDLWVIRDNRAEKREAVLGKSSYEYIEVLQGLAEGERIIVSDMSPYTDRETIKIKQTHNTERNGNHQSGKRH